MSIRILIATSAAALAAMTACSSSKSNNTSAGGQTSAGGSVTISAKGSTLTGPDGHTLYANTVDTASNIQCTGECASEWPPVTGTPAAGAGVDSSKLGTATRPDGKMQVTYDGHPLYEFEEDKSAGDMKGEGQADQGGTWHVATVSGTPSGSQPAGSSGAGGGGGGY
jgi:predicted lipoprotein with Yx(FWY)xxD motif